MDVSPCAAPSTGTVWTVIASALLGGLVIATAVSFISALSQGDECPYGTGLIVSPRLWSIVHGSLWLRFGVLIPLPFLSCCRDGWVLRWTTWCSVLVVATALFIWILLGMVTFIQNTPVCLIQGTTAVSAVVTMSFEFVIGAVFVIVTSVQSR